MAGFLAAIDRGWRARAVKTLVWLLCVVPAGGMFWEFQNGVLGPNPTEELLHQTGQTALFFLFAALAITPLRRLFHFNRLQRFRRMIGVWSFAYAVSHVSIYLLLDQACISWADCQPAFIAKDLLRRPFIFVGMLAFTILLALAVTSTNGWVRRLGKRWQTLHRLAYVAAIAGVVHFIWRQKSDITVPMRWAWVLALLLGIRVYLSIRKRMALRQTAGRAEA